MELVPLCTLSIDDNVNVRKTGRGSEPGYVASIRAKGIIEPLTVRTHAGGYKITNGGKRYASLEWMREHGESAAGVPVTGDYMVKVSIREETDEEALDTSLMTNLIRTGMHPVDEYEAFVALEAQGETVDDIAARYGLAVRSVRQRMALGKLSPKVRDAWRAGTIRADVAMALTLAPTTKAQEAALKSVTEGNWDAWHVRREFAGKHDRDTGKLIQFVGVDALREAGAEIVEDLFGTDHRATDPKLVVAMAAEKIEAECERLVAEGWSWALPYDSPEAESSYSWQVVHHERGEGTKEEAERLAVLRAILDSEDDDAYDAADEEIDLIQQTIRLRAFSVADRAKSGCILSINDRGGLQIRAGLMKPAAARQHKAEQKQIERKKAGQPEEVGPALSMAVVSDLNRMLTEAAANAVSKDITLALRLALVALMTNNYTTNCIAIKGDGLSSRTLRGEHKEFEDVFNTVWNMAPSTVEAELARHIAAALTFAGYMGDRRALEDGSDAALICGAIDPDDMKEALLEAFQPKLYFPRIGTALTLKAIEEAVSAEEARRVGKLKKADAVAFALENVVDTGWLPPELRTAQYDGPGAKKAERPAKAKKSPKKKKAA